MTGWDTDIEFLATFRAEAGERLESLAEGLISLEKNPADQDLIRRLFREAHTLKGSAGMMGLAPIRDLSHRIEDVLSALQKKQIEAAPGVIDALLSGIDRIRQLLPAEGGDVSGSDDIAQEMARLAAVLGADASPDEPGEAAPSPAQEFLSTLSTAATAPEAPVVTAAAPSHDATIRVNIERLDKLLNLMGEIMVYQHDSEDSLGGLTEIKEHARELQILLTDLASQAEKLKTDPSESAVAALRQKLSDAGGNVGRLTERLDDTATGFEQNCASRRLVLDELQEQALSVRMLPVGTIFKAFPRLVRDDSAAAGKLVRLETAGGECELDKRILEQISDPLMHILRNAVHHGIESPDRRVAAGKPEEGVIRLSAAQRGDRVEITIADNGAGIDPEKVKAMAVNKGIVAADEEFTAAAAHDLIFRAGLSTADSISDISGRGVGLDVVRHNIESLEGNVEVASAPGEGTKFTVTLPVTLAVITALMVESNEDRFALPLSYIREMVALDAAEIQSLGGQSGFLMRGAAVPLLDMHEFIGGRPTECEGNRVSVVIVGNERFQLGLKVGRLLGEQETVIKSIEGFLPRLPFVAGVCIMGSGDAAIVTNVSEILNRAREGIHSRVAAAPAPAPVKRALDARRPLLLVVEDSLVVRELQKNILQSAGYEVETAVDGEDALSHLEKKSFDCVITDVEMPRMNGIDLTAAVRRNEETRDTPVVIVTSRANDDDRRLGLDAGADAYMMKGAFDQKNLLAAIERLVA